jgi:hypothetical protein
VLTTDAAPNVEVAAMRTGTGERIGSASISDAEPTQIVLDVPGWTMDESRSAPTRYLLAVEQEDGSRHLVELPARYGATWTTPIPVDAEDVQAVAIIDREGRIYCSARFTD